MKLWPIQRWDFGMICGDVFHEEHRGKRGESSTDMECDRCIFCEVCYSHCCLLTVAAIFPVVSQVMRESWPASSFHPCPACCTAVPTQGCWPCGSGPPVLLFQMVCSISVRRWWRNPENNSACLNLFGVWKQVKDLYSCTDNYQS